MTPLSVVQPLAGPYKGSAGVVESVERDDNGKVQKVVVDMDRDHKRVTFKPAELAVLRPH